MNPGWEHLMEERATRPSDAEGGCTIFVASDATGLTAERVVQSALAQFAQKVGVVRFSHLRSREDVRAVVRRAVDEGGVIVHTLVMEDLRDAMLEEGRGHQIQTIDLMGPLLSRLSLRLRVSPHSQPGLFRKMDEDYYRRIEAVDYTVKHDDGQNIQDLPRSDIVIMGVSRTCKTPLSIYLAYQGWRVANVPLVEVAGLPGAIEKVRPESIVALTMQPDSLVRVRSNRLRRIGQHLPGHYNDHDKVEQETRWARRLYRERGWPVIDVTNKSIEEIATEVISLVRRRRTDPPDIPSQGQVRH